MNRRKFGVITASATMWASSSIAREAGAVVKIGFLSGTTPSASWNQCFRDGLRDLGWTEGENTQIDYRWTGGVSKRYSELAAELVRLKPSLIVTSSTPGAQAVQQLTHTLPVVFMAVSDPVSSGIVDSLARPGANLTGLTNFLPATTGKLLEFLKTAAPGVARVAVLYNPDNPGKVLELDELRIVARTLGVTIQPLELRSTGDVEGAILALTRLQSDSIVTLVDGVTLANRKPIADLAITRRLPSIYQLREFVEAGGLLSYGLDYCQHYRRAANYVDRILKGARPSDLPVELPSAYELVLNLKTAQSIGLALPESLVVRADDLIH